MEKLCKSSCSCPSRTPGKTCKAVELFEAVWRFEIRRIALLVLCFVLYGCVGCQGVRFPAARQASENQAGLTAQRNMPQSEILDWGWSERIITEDELIGLEMKDPALDASVTHQILARLNSKTEFHIYDDIRNGRPLKVPNDFRAYRDWTPLPRQMNDLSHIPKCILVVKNIPFLGWYENGQLVGDSQVGLGVPGEETKSGVYKILQKAADIHSLSYNNDLGEPSWMPWAMRIYGAVWIHAGDVSGPFCSHGCVMLPMNSAEELFFWADSQTTVVILDSLSAPTFPERGRNKSVAK